MKKERVSLKWIAALAALIMVITFMAACGGSDTTEEDDPDDYYGDGFQWMIGGDQDENGYAEVENGVDEPPAYNVPQYGYSPVVARAGHMYVNAEDVRREIFWALNELMWEYIELFPDDEVFVYGRLFRGDMTFGEVVREEAARLALLIKFFEEYAIQHGLHFDNNDEHLHVINVVIHTILDDPALFEEFASYMVEDYVSEAQIKAAAILERVLAGEDFDTLMATYGDDPGMRVHPEGYTFTSGAMVTEFEEAVRELEIGGISGLVQTQFGFHIIKRIEPNPDAEQILRPWGAPPPEEGEEEELFGAKHILIESMERAIGDLMVEAIFLAFEARIDDMDLVFLPGFYDIDVEQ